jgi:hypothetical protein
MVESDEGYLGFVANASIKEILKGGGMKAQWFFEILGDTNPSLSPSIRGR